MIKSSKLFLFLLLASPLFVQAQQLNEEFIDWNADRPLAWDDYKCKPDRSSDAAATTTTYLGIEYKFASDNTFSYKIACRFSKNKSWGLYRNDHILGHEQGHFDITEIFARKLNKVTSEYKFNKRTYQKDLEKIYNEVTQEKEDFQNQYDEETDYSRNKIKQAEWLKKIKVTLDEYQAYAYYDHGGQFLTSAQQKNSSGTNKALRKKHRIRH
jgi:hypothetical protein